MRAVIQRVAWAEVEVEGRVVGRTGPGLLVYAGVGHADAAADAQKLAEKVATLRIFADEEGKLNRSVQDARGGVLAVPSFTLMADARKGRRPTFEAAAPGAKAVGVFETFVGALRRAGCAAEAGVFGADMQIRSQADGPVNILLDLPPQTPSAAAPGAPAPRET